jgi:SAM-dependent methyltransferase
MARDLPEAARRDSVYTSVSFASATDLPFPDRTFNTVLANCVIEHIPNLDRVLSEIGRVLRVSGTFATTLPSDHFPDLLLGSTLFRKLGLRRLGEAYGRFFNRISYHHHIYSPAVWQEKLAAANLAVEEHFYYFSAASHRRFDLCHYLGLPNLLSKRLLGRWVLFPGQMKPFELWLRPYYEEPLPALGAYQFVRCRKV